MTLIIPSSCLADNSVHANITTMCQVESTTIEVNSTQFYVFRQDSADFDADVTDGLKTYEVSS